MEKHKVESRNIPISYPWLSGKPIVALWCPKFVMTMHPNYIRNNFTWMLIDWKCTWSEQNTIIFPLNNQNVHFQYQCKSSHIRNIQEANTSVSFIRMMQLGIYMQIENSIVGKQWPRKVIHYGNVHVLRWFPVTLALIYKPIIDLLLI